jgi:hypothetical protein
MPAEPFGWGTRITYRGMSPVPESNGGCIRPGFADSPNGGRPRRQKPGDQSDIFLFPPKKANVRKTKEYSTSLAGRGGLSFFKHGLQGREK